MTKTANALTGLLFLIALEALVILFPLPAQTTGSQQTASSENKVGSKELLESGKTLFEQQCGFCHGRDANGGETGPSLIDSELVRRDKTGAEISNVIRNGRPEKGMPKFDLANTAMSGLIAFIYNQQLADATNGKRRGVRPADLQTGNAKLGQQYFEGAGRCATCHSVTGDLAHVGTRLIGLKLEQQMLYPNRAKSTATITVPGGKSFSGEVAYDDEFAIAIRDSEGRYRSWTKTANLKLNINAPAEAHVELLSKYTDGDIHNLMAYLQKLK